MRSAIDAIAIPYGAYWSTPFARWQGSLAHLHSLTFAAHVAKQALRRRAIEPTVFDHAVLGLTVPPDSRRAVFPLAKTGLAAVTS